MEEHRLKEYLSKYKNVLFDESVNEHYKERIIEAYEVLDKLNVDVSKNVYFEIKPKLRRALGKCCLSERNSRYDFKILLSEELESDNSFVNTTIHELLHTVNLKCGHKGIWKKLADYVTLNSKYNITQHKYNANHDVKKDLIIKNMSEIEQKEYIDNLVSSNQIEDLKTNFFDLYFWIKNFELRDKLAVYYLENLIINGPSYRFSMIKHFDGFIFTERVNKILATNYIGGKYDSILTTFSQACAFDALFSLTERYLYVSSYTNSRFLNRT